MHQHASGVLLAFALPFVIALLAYLLAVRAEHRRGRAWPARRTASWTGGVLVAAGASAIGFSSWLGAGFVAHMTMHLLAGMLAPVLLVLGAPVTLALRSLAPVPARRLSRLLKSRPLRVLTHPVTAALISLVPLWWIIQASTAVALAANGLLHAVVFVHVLLAGYLFTASIVGIDPSPHRAGFALRAVVLVLAIAAHGIMAKLLVARAPENGPDDLQTAARLMYSGGDLFELVLVTVFCLQWYRASRPRTRPGPGFRARVPATGR